jgi:hypothetical protein
MLARALSPKLERHVDVDLGLTPQLVFHRGEDHHEVFIRAQLSRALYSDVEAWNERRQPQPIEDADAEIQDSAHHGSYAFKSGIVSGVAALMPTDSR